MCLSINTYSQQINALNFDTWTPISGCTTIDSASNFTFFDIERYRFPPKTCPTNNSVEKSTDKFEGTFAMKIKGIPNGSTYFSNELDLANSIGGQGIDFAYKPYYLRVHIKFNKAGNDTAGINITLNDIGYNIIGSGKTTFINSSPSGYETVDIPINYLNSNNIEKISLKISLGNSTGDADAASYLIVDGFEFIYTPSSALSYNPNSIINIYTNNSDEIIFSEEVSDININNIFGLNQLTKNNKTSKMSTSSLTTGIYIITYKYKDQYYSKKIFIE
jgi:hypothetical protein